MKLTETENKKKLYEIQETKRNGRNCKDIDGTSQKKQKQNPLKSQQLEEE